MWLCSVDTAENQAVKLLFLDSLWVASDRVARCSGWEVTWVAGYLQQCRCQLVQWETGGVPCIRLAATEEVSLEVCLSHLWQFGPIFNARVHCSQDRKRWAQRLDGISTCFDTCCCVWVLSLPSLVEVVKNIVSVWPLIFSNVNDTGCKTDNDGLLT